MFGIGIEVLIPAAVLIALLLVPVVRGRWFQIKGVLYHHGLASVGFFLLYQLMIFFWHSFAGWGDYEGPFTPKYQGIAIFCISGLVAWFFISECMRWDQERIKREGS